MTTVAALAAHAGWGPGLWWPFFPLFWIVFWGAVVFAIFRFRGGRWHHVGSAENVLAERYARGEITVEEYRERLGVLRTRRY